MWQIVSLDFRGLWAEKKEGVEEKEQVAASGGFYRIFHKHREDETAPKDDIQQCDFGFAEEKWAGDYEEKGK